MEVIYCNKCGKSIKADERVRFKTPYEGDAKSKSLLDDVDLHIECALKLFDLQKFLAPIESVPASEVQQSAGVESEAKSSVKSGSKEESTVKIVSAEQVQALILQGLSNKEISAKLGVVAQTVANIKHKMVKSGQLAKPVRKSGAKQNSSTTPEDKDAEVAREKQIDTGKIKALANTGWSPNRIASDMGLDVDTVKSVLAEIRKH